MGVGLGFTFVPTVSVTVHHFKRRRALATGVALSGSSTGAVIFPISMSSKSYLTIMKLNHPQMIVLKYGSRVHICRCLTYSPTQPPYLFHWLCASSSCNGLHRLRMPFDRQQPREDGTKFPVGQIEGVSSGYKEFLCRCPVYVGSTRVKLCQTEIDFR
jgi:hypothetical protein